MPKGPEDTLQKVLERLMYLDPPIKKFPVTPEDPAMAVYFIDLKDVCYITTKADQGREEIMFMTSGDKAYFSNLRLSEIGDRLKDHPHFLQTSKFYMVNLTRIRALRISSARDVWFDGLEKPVLNAVSNTYLPEFEKRMK
jgi:DNA-binding LytR/AlgR family response regulator